MRQRSPFGLRTRIVIILAVVMVIFVALTEITVSRIVEVSFAKHDAAAAIIDKSAAAAQRTADFLRMRRLVIFYLVFGSFFVLALGSFALTRLVVRPLKGVSEAVERVAGGDLRVQIPTRGTGEINDLSQAFNRMTTTLKEQRSELEKRLARIEESSLQLAATQDKLIRAAKLASVGTMAAGIAHEIGNPLAGLIGLVDTLEYETDAETTARYRALMRKEIERIDRIISELLNYARAGDHSDHGVPSASLPNILNHTRTLLSAQKIFDRIELKFELPEGPLEVVITSDLLTQLLLNIFLNSADAMHGKGLLTLKARVADNQMVEMVISDSGPGIPRELAERVFDPFFTTKSAGKGTGLGLAICQSICERVGGEIEINPRFTGGAQFVVTLPLSRG